MNVKIVVAHVLQVNGWRLLPGVLCADSGNRLDYEYIESID